MCTSYTPLVAHMNRGVWRNTLQEQNKKIMVLLPSHSTTLYTNNNSYLLNDKKDLLQTKMLVIICFFAYKIYVQALLVTQI